MKIPSKSELHQIAFNHSLDIDFIIDFILTLLTLYTLYRLYKNIIFIKIYSL